MLKSKVAIWPDLPKEIPEICDSLGLAVHSVQITTPPVKYTVETWHDKEVPAELGGAHGEALGNHHGPFRARGNPLRIVVRIGPVRVLRLQPAIPDHEQA